MDSMRSLNTSLPTSSTNYPAPPEQLLQAFRTAALSVTNLYKSAVTDQANARQTGYQDAIDDLLAFLDKENLGLQDGEGWSVRQWATERHERKSSPSHHTESDDDGVEPEKERSTSPSRSHLSDEVEVSNNETNMVVAAAVPEPEVIKVEAIPIEESHPPMYRFTGVPSIPSDTPMHSGEHVPPEANTADPALRVEVVNRALRTPHRHGGARHSTRASTRDFTFTAGTKRKLNFPDFFDISGLSNDRDNGSKGVGKRGRFV